MATVSIQCHELDEKIGVVKEWEEMGNAGCRARTNAAAVHVLASQQVVIGSRKPVKD